MRVPAPGFELGELPLRIGAIVGRADLVRRRRQSFQPRLLVGGVEGGVETGLQSGLARRAFSAEAEHGRTRLRLSAGRRRSGLGAREVGADQGRRGKAGDQGEAAGGYHGRLRQNTFIGDVSRILPLGQRR